MPCRFLPCYFIDLWTFLYSIIHRTSYAGGALTPDNRMKRWTYCGFGLWLLSDWIEILGIFAGIMLFISLVYYSWKTSVYLKDK